MPSIANEGAVTELADFLSETIPRLASSSRARDWTDAVFLAFHEYAAKDGRTDWQLYPEDRAKKGEYLCDFMLFQTNYGPRIACESQWEHHERFGPHQSNLDWAFDKLRGVKADIKVFICEATVAEWNKVKTEYLTNYELLSTEEAFLLLRWDHDHFEKAWWKPKENGSQSQAKFTNF